MPDRNDQQPHTRFFLGAVSFVLGAGMGGLGVPPFGAAVIGMIGILAAWRIGSRMMLLGVAVAFMFGNLLYAYDDYRYHEARRSVERAVVFEAVVSATPRVSATYQTVAVRIPEHTARALVRTDQYTPLTYGDTLVLRGTVVPPPDDAYGRYLAKERIHGTFFYPDIDITSADGSRITGGLISAHERIEHILAHYFTPAHAAFLSGILLGERSGLSREFQEKLSISGTMHLTALSGLHMAIIVFLAFTVFRIALPGQQRLQFVATFLLITLFVAMTGFKVSAVRASLMAFLVGLARESGRVYSPRNALACAALLITAENPKAPVFDIGFQLSFAATVSIIYFTPVLDRLAIFARAGFIGWREVLKITLAAQIGVAPITIAYFSNFSLTALPANVALLVVMPILMALGFATVMASIIFPPAAIVLAYPTAFLVDYARAVIDTFAAFRLPFNPEMHISSIILYYAVTVWLWYRYAPRDDAPTPPHYARTEDTHSRNAGRD